MTYPRWGLSVEDAEASKLQVLRSLSRYDVAPGESLELHVLLGMFPPVALGLGGMQRGKERPLKVASGEALNTSWIIPPLPFSSHCIAIVYRMNLNLLFLVFKPGTI